MVVDDQPALAILDIREAVARGEGFAFTVLHIRERVITRVDRRISIYTDQVIAESNLKTGKNLEGTHEIICISWNSILQVMSG